jgi:hypothetical protein
MERDFILDTRAAYEGQRVDIADGEESRKYWLRPCKLPVQVMDEINTLQAQLLGDNVDLEAVRKAADGVESLKEGDAIPPELAAALMPALHRFHKDYNVNVYRLALLHGVCEHNLPRDGKLVGDGHALDEPMVEALLAQRPQAAKVGAEAILVFNRPLPHGNAESSAKWRNGSTAATRSRAKHNGRTVVAPRS